MGEGQNQSQTTIYGCEIGVSLNHFVSILLGVTYFILLTQDYYRCGEPV